MSVAESIVIFSPMLHVGWASASAAVTSVSSSRRRPRNGPPEAVITMPVTAPGGAPSRHCASAECSLSTGRSRFPLAAAAASTSSPPATRLSLLASATSAPAAKAASVARRPAAPTIAFRTRSAPLLGDQLLHAILAREHAGSAVQVARGPGSGVGVDECDERHVRRPRGGASPSASRFAESAHARRSGLPAITSSACLPMEPVAPRTATDLMRPV